MSASVNPLGKRFPAAHQFLRMCLFDEIFPIAPSVSCRADEVAPERWLIAFAWPELDYEASETFSSDDLRRVFGPWSSWARTRALDIAELLPV